MMGIYFDKVVGLQPATLLIIELVQFFSSVFWKLYFSEYFLFTLKTQGL